MRAQNLCVGGAGLQRAARSCCTKTMCFWLLLLPHPAGAVDESLDLSIVFLPRTEVRCHRCKGHLGHV